MSMADKDYVMKASKAVNNDIPKIYESKTDAEAKLTEAKKYADNKVAGLVNSAPEALDTLSELSKALGDDKNFAANVLGQIGGMESKVDIMFEPKEAVGNDYVSVYSPAPIEPVELKIYGGSTQNGSPSITNATEYNPVIIYSVGRLITDDSSENGKYEIPITIAGQKYSIYSKEPLRKVGDNADFFDYKTKRIVRNVHRFEINSSDEIYTYEYKGMLGVRIINKMREPGRFLPGMCTYSPIVREEYAKTNVIWCGPGNTTDVVFWIGILDVLGYTTVEEFKNWLDTLETPVEVIYALKTPYYESVETPKIILPESNGFDIFTSDSRSRISLKYYTFADRIALKKDMEYLKDDIENTKDAAENARLVANISYSIADSAVGNMDSHDRRISGLENDVDELETIAQNAQDEVLSLNGRLTETISDDDSATILYPTSKAVINYVNSKTKLPSKYDRVLNTRISNNTIRNLVKELAPNDVFYIKPGMEGEFYPSGGATLGFYDKDNNLVANMNTGLFRSVENGAAIVSSPEYPFGTDGKASTVSGIECGLDVHDDVLKLEGGTSGDKYLGDFTHGAVSSKPITVKFDLYMSKYEKFQICPTSFENFANRTRYGLEIDVTGEIRKLVITEPEPGKSEWKSYSLTEPLYFPLDEWHEIALSYNSAIGSISIYIDGNYIFDYTGVSMPKGTPKDFTVIGGQTKQVTYMNNIEIYEATYGSITDSNRICSYMKQTIGFKHRISIIYLNSMATPKSHHHEYVEGAYFKNGGSGTAYIYYSSKGGDDS